MTATNDSNGPAHRPDPTAQGSRGQPDGPPTEAAGLDFPDVARLELDSLLRQLRDRADDVLGTQGRLRGLLSANAAVAADLSLPVVLHRVAESARVLLDARYAAIGVIGGDRKLEQFVHAGMPSELVTEIGELPLGRGILGLLISRSDSDPSR